MDKCEQNVLRYPTNRDLFSQERYPVFEPEPDG